MGKKKHDAHYFNKKSCLTAPKPLNKMEIGKAARYIPAAPQAAVCAERNQKRGLRHTVISATMPIQAFPIHIKPWLISWQPAGRVKTLCKYTTTPCHTVLAKAAPAWQPRSQSHQHIPQPNAYAPCHQGN